MNRIEALFRRLKTENRRGLVGYLTAGDPNVEQSERDVRTALDNGVDLLELGLPFSDPTADGPTIQAAAGRALAAGMTLPRALDMVRRLRADYDQPLVLFGYANPLFRYGYERFCADAAEAGADGLLIVDLPFEVSEEIRPCAERHGLDPIALIAPTTSPERAGRILAKARGFVYYIMVKGVTGARAALVEDLAARVDALRGVTNLPIAAGFGVSDGGQAADVARAADAVVVGSALVRAARQGTLAEKVRELKDAIAQSEATAKGTA